MPGKRATNRVERAILLLAALKAGTILLLAALKAGTNGRRAGLWINQLTAPSLLLLLAQAISYKPLTKQQKSLALSARVRTRVAHLPVPSPLALAAAPPPPPLPPKIPLRLPFRRRTPLLLEAPPLLARASLPQVKPPFCRTHDGPVDKAKLATVFTTLLESTGRNPGNNAS